jgi:hypothetical protein
MIGRDVELHVDELVVDTTLGPTAAERLEPVLRAALDDLAKRLERAPAGRWRNTTRLALDRLCIDGLTESEILGPWGAARLADAFWEQLIGQRNLR